MLPLLLFFGKELKGKVLQGSHAAEVLHALERVHA
jgi:hypothetical protein